MTLRRWLVIIGSFFMLSACSNNEDVTGSFEESPQSGRLLEQTDPEIKNGIDIFRYFRFHLRQFDDDIGGTFETFDLNSYSQFSRLPVIINTPMPPYYCARIDYGYARNGKAYIYFTDLEQRHWAYITELGNSTLSGQLMRVHANGIDMYTYPDHWLMPEDYIYYSLGGQPSKEMIFSPMEDKDQNSLKCIYYYRSTEVDFIIPKEVFEYCTTSECNNLRLAVIGTEPQMKFLSTQMPATFEILSATLQPVDIVDNTRTIIMRDNPFTKIRSTNGLITATAFIYDDTDFNGHWSTNEPVYAGMTKNLFLFYDENTEPQFYGRIPEEAEAGNDEKKLIISKEAFAKEKPGWVVCADDGTIKTGQFWRSPKSIVPGSNTVRLQSVRNESSLSCLLNIPASPDNDPNVIKPPYCSGFFPLLFR